jgi:hypothetical protein
MWLQITLKFMFTSSAFSLPKEAASNGKRRIWRRAYTSNGDSLDYTYEADEDTLTMWMGPKGSPAVFRAKWSDDNNTLTGAWEWPGGGYQAMMTRIKSK